MKKFLKAMKNLKWYTKEGQTCCLAYCSQTKELTPFVAFFEEDEPTDCEGFYFIHSNYSFN